MRTGKLQLLVSIALIASCGGGGSGSNSGATTTDTAPPPPPAVDTLGTAIIHFPVTDALANRSNITVRGTAKDANGVAAVTVKRVSASPLSVQATLTPNPGDNKEVSFSASIPLEAGDNNLEVIVEDEQQNIVEETDSRLVSYTLVPSTFSLDPDNSRLLGSVYDEEQFKLTSYNYETGEQLLHAGRIPTPLNRCFLADSETFVYATFAPGIPSDVPSDTVIELRGYNLGTDAEEHYGSIRWDEDNWTAGIRNSMVCDPEANTAYLLFNEHPEIFGSAPPISQIRAWDLDTGDISLLSITDPDAAEPWYAAEIFLWNGDLLSHSGLNYGLRRLTRIDKLSGERAVAFDHFPFHALTLAPGGDESVFAVTPEGVEEINAVTGDRALISPGGATESWSFSQPRTAAFDPGKSLLMVGDSSLKTIIGVDTESGVRFPLLSRNRGLGTKLDRPRRIAVNSEETMIYAVDEGNGGRLFEIDIDSGDRRTIGDISPHTGLFISGLALDEQRGKVYVSSGRTAVEVDLATGDIRILASNLVGSGAATGAINDIEADSARNRLLLATHEAILALDLDTLERTVVSQIFVRGEGESFLRWPVLALNKTGELYAYSNESDNSTARLMSVDLETGDRHLLANDCFPSDNDPDTPTLLAIDMAFDDNRGAVMMQAFELVSFIVEDGSCIKESPPPELSLGLTLGADSTVYLAQFNQLGQFDLASGEHIILSQ